MPIRVVFDHPHRHTVRRARRYLAAFVGGLMIAVGLVASVLPVGSVVLMVGGAISTLAAGHELELGRPSADWVRAWAITSVVALVGLGGGLRLVRGRRRLVLVLRRFGFTDATRAVSFATAKSIGRSWRLVTLDDASIAPVGVAKGARRVSVVGVLVSLGIIVAGFYWLHGGGFGRYLRGVTYSSNMSAHSGNNNVADAVADIFASMIGTMIAVTITGLIALVAVTTLTLIFVMTGLFAWSSYASARRAERSKAAHVSSRRDIETTTRSIARRTRKIISPRLMVARVVSPVWREAVGHLSQVASVALIDISVPSENLLWQIETLSRRFGSRWVLVGSYHELGGLAAGGGWTAPPGSLTRRLSALLDGQKVLAYTTDRAGMKRFSRALRDKLETLSD